MRSKLISTLNAYLQCPKCCGLETVIKLTESLSYFSHEPLERESLDKKFRGFLVAADFSEGDGTRAKSLSFPDSDTYSYLIKILIVWTPPNILIWVIEQAFRVLKDQKDQPLSFDAEDFLAALPPVDLRANCFGLGASPSAPTPKSTKAPCFVRTMFNGIWINPSLYLDSKSTINVILTQLAEDIWNSEARNYQQVKHVTYKS